MKYVLSSVLVIDDDEKMRELLTTILEGEGYYVESAANGKQAIEACKKVHFDVALIDIELPDVKGTVLLRTLKEIKPKMVRIIVTGHPSIENAVKAINEKADGYILKPFNPSELLETIKRVFAEKENEYLNALKEVEEGRKNTPQFKYKSPEKWGN